MATEDERYRQSSQYRLWSYTPSTLLELRQKTNSLAKQQIAARLSQDASTPLPEFLTAEEEAQLTKLFMVQLIQAAIFCELPTEIRATAAIFLQRFYVTNSIMTYPPAELLKTSLFFACKSEGSMWQSGRLAEKFPNTTGEQVLAGEFLLCQGIRFAFDIRHPFRALDGAILELKKRLPAESERRIRKAHVDAREVLKYSSLVTDAYFHYTPSQIMMAALMIADSELVDMLFEGSSELVENAELTRKIRSTIQECKALLETEPPTRLAEYWGKVCSILARILEPLILTSPARNSQDDEASEAKTEQVQRSG